MSESAVIFKLFFRSTVA